MKKILIIIFAFFAFGVMFLFQTQKKNVAFAQSPTPTIDQSIVDGDWLPDTDVTFQGKTASRSALLLNLVLTNYQWVNTVSNGDAPLIIFWTKIRNIVYAILLLVLLAAAFAIIISGGKSLTAWKFARRFVIMVILIWFSYALCRFLYEFVDIIIGFFNRNPDGVIITSKDLFNMSFNYQDFIGLRRFGPSYNESAFVSLLLVRLTAITYYVMAGILLVRKIILWFFIAVSPIYPLLLFHFPIRNTAKIWIGEFFRWLLYAPLFFIFLSSLVIIWRSNINLFPFNFATKPIVYPTAINILLGGPGQQLTVENSVNYNDTFAEYIIALIMLWLVIFMPFILLRIFLDYLWSLNIDKGYGMNFIQNLMKRVPGNQLFFPNTPVPPSPISPAPPPGTRPTGMAKPILVGTAGVARELPFGERMEKQQTVQISKPSVTNIQNVYQTPAFKSEKISTETMKLVNLQVPRMRDIARFETNRMSSNVSRQQEISRMHTTLEKIANPQVITNNIEKQQFTQLREKLLQQSQKGEPLATSILSAASSVSRVSVSQMQQQAVSLVQQNYSKMVSPQSVTIDKIAQPQAIINPVEKQQYIALRETLVKEKEKGNNTAKTILAATDTVLKQREVQNSLPQVNQVQTVNLEDYEEVKKTWLENYKKMDVPKTADTAERTRRQWIEQDANKLSKTIDLLNSKDQQKVDDGMKEVSSLLPFLLIGGFSQTEVVSYLQAKKHAADEALTEIKEKENEEETLVEAKHKEAQASLHLTTSVAREDTNYSVTSSEDTNEDNPLSQIVNRYSERVKSINQGPKLKSEQTSLSTMKLISFPIPTMRDVARYESDKFKTQQTSQQEVMQVNEMIRKLANPEAISDSDEKKRLIIMNQQLTDAGQKGDPLANSIIFAVNTIRQMQLPSQANQKPQVVSLPQANNVQTVNLDDYEEVRRTWYDIYKTSQIPESQNISRKEWLQKDVTKLMETVSLLKSGDQNNIANAMKEVSSLLPFLLIGGFSQAEIVAYLQAKMQAGQDVIRELNEAENEEEQKVNVQSKKPEQNLTAQSEQAQDTEKKSNQ